MTKVPLFRTGALLALAALLPGTLLGQTISRVAPVAPAAQTAAAAARVPLVQQGSFLQNMALTGALTLGSMQPVLAPALPDLDLPPGLPSTALEVPAPSGAVPVVHVEGTPWAAASLPPGEAGVETPSPSLPTAERRQGGREDFRHSRAARSIEASLSEAGALFDGTKVQSQGVVDVAENQTPTPPARSFSRPETANLSGSALLDSAHEISGRGFNEKSYAEARDFMYSVADHVEHQGRSGILDAYSGTFLPGKGGDGGGYKEPGDANGDGYTDHGVNTEHIWPQSFFDRALPMRSDLHHLMATLEHPNSIRSNFPFGKITNPRPEYSNRGGAKMDRGVFEPPDFTKGRVARAAFYFFARYYNRRIFFKGGDRFWSRGMIETLMSWNREFPPSQFEKDRNDIVERFQGNRNPFIDDPLLAERIGVDAFLGRDSGGSAKNDRPQGSSAEHHGRGGSQGESGRRSHETAGRSAEPKAQGPIRSTPSLDDDFLLGLNNDGWKGSQSRKHGKRWEKRPNRKSRDDHYSRS
ncbi:MAG: endonuclease [Elusimicrobia bacterium]|nr:endonuclease [Elusimicrobiota bacterium]